MSEKVLDINFSVDEYPYLRDKFKKHFPDASHLDIVKMISIAIDVCSGCKNNDGGCQCWNDE